MSGDSMDSTPLSVLEEAARQAAGSDAPDKCLVLFLWTEGGKYDTRFFNAGMSSSECISLLAVNQSKFIRIMEQSP